ncbi:MAG: TetR/AcrR family transcriptional regulator [Clostridia bacterium]|nr:TetR/AcrR family transcriptional regulator [Clostridia bacterium]
MKEEQIVSSARTLFLKYGIKKVSMDEIAKNAGVTKKTVYSYFGSKADLINFFIKEELNNMKKIVEEYQNNSNDFLEKVHQGLYKMLTYKKESFFINLIIKEQDSFNVKMLKESLKSVDGEIKNFIKQILLQAKNDGYIEVKNIDITTFLIYKMYIALMFEWDEEFKKLNDKEIADNILHILKNGIITKKVIKERK